MHIEGHLNIKAKCPYCPTMFTKTSCLMVHKKKLHSQDLNAEQDFRNQQTNKFACSFCSKIWNSEASLTEHHIEKHNNHKNKVIRTEKEIVQMVDTELITKESGLITEFKYRICSIKRPSIHYSVKYSVRKHIEKHFHTFVSCYQ